MHVLCHVREQNNEKRGDISMMGYLEFVLHKLIERDRRFLFLQSFVVVHVDESVSCDALLHRL